jgi:serine protease
MRHFFKRYSEIKTVIKPSMKLNTLVLATSLALTSSFAATAASGGAINSNGNRNTAPRINMGAINTDTKFDRFIVKYRQGTPEAINVRELQASLNGASVKANQMIQAERAKKGLKSSAANKPMKINHVRKMGLGTDVIIASEKLDRASTALLMREVAANPNVEYIQIDSIMKPTLSPNDPLYSAQWGFQDADAGIRADQAWDVSTGSGIVVAVIDTGITSHSDLNANIVDGYDFISDTSVSNDGDGRDADPSDPGDWTTGQCGAAENSSWHGTHVAGTVAAVTNNAAGVAGTAFGAKVMPVRALGTCGGFTSDIADGIIWASGGSVPGVPSLSASNAADVINMSLGGGGACDATTQAAVDSAVSRGTTVVVAAGNSNADSANFSPASCSNLINVASVTSSSARSSFSNFGSLIDVSGPGSGIRSTMNSGTTTPGNETYVDYSGTSMASPHVAGTVALIQSRRATLGLAPFTPAEVEANLKSTAYALAGSCSGGCGAGIINAKAAVDAAAGGGTPGQTYSNNSPVDINDNATVDSTITVTGRDGNGPSNASVTVAISHTYQGDLKVDLVAPDGSVFNIHNRTGAGTDNLNKTTSFDLSSKPLNGVWTLRINDNANADTGRLNSWSITF